MQERLAWTVDPCVVLLTRIPRSDHGNIYHGSLSSYLCDPGVILIHTRIVVLWPAVATHVVACRCMRSSRYTCRCLQAAWIAVCVHTHRACVVSRSEYGLCERLGFIRAWFMCAEARGLATPAARLRLRTFDLQCGVWACKEACSVGL